MRMLEESSCIRIVNQNKIYFKIPMVNKYSHYNYLSLTPTVTFKLYFLITFIYFKY